MKKKKAGETDQLWKRAAAKVRSETTKLDDMSVEDIQKLIDELEVHQIELETRNQELRDTQARLQESHTKYADLYDFAPVGYLTLDEDGLVVEANLTAARQLGIKRSRLMKSRFFVHIVRADRDAFRSHLNSTLKTEANQSCEIRLMRRNARGFCAQLNTIFIKDANGNRLLRTSVKDISGRKRTEDALLESEERFRKLVEASFEGIAIIEQGILIDANPRLAEMTGYELHEMIGKPGVDFIVPEDRELVWQNMSNRCEAPYEGRILRKDGTVITVEARGRHFLRDGLNIRVTAIHDITERKRNEKALQQHDHALSERVKELNCLYGIASLRERRDVILEELLQGVADLIPPSWQYPEITCARITLNEQEFKTGNFSKTFRGQSVDIIVFGERVGVVEINYLEERPASEEGPSRKEERNLLKAIAERLGKIIEHKRTEEALRESESTARALLNAPSQAVGLLDAEGIILDLNETTAQRLGKKRDELRGLNICDLLPPAVVEHRKAFIEKVIQSGEPIRFVDEREGIWNDHTVYPVFDAEGKVSKVAVLSHDITDRKLAEAERERLMRDLDRARLELEKQVEARTAELVAANKQLNEEIEERKRVEEALQTASQQWQATFDAVRDAIWVMGPDYRIIRCNKSTIDLLKKEPDEILGQYCCTAVHGTSHPIPECPMPRMKETGRRASVEFPMNERWFGVSVDPILDETGAVQNVVHIIRDITEQKRAAEQLRQSEEKYRNIFEQSTLGIFQSGPDGKFISANPSLARMLGYESPESLIASVHCIPDQIYARPEVRSEVKQSLEESDRATLQVEFHRRDLTSGTANMHMRTVRDKDGSLLYLEGFVEDITERKRAEEQIRQSKGMLQTIFDGISDFLIMVDQEGLVKMLNKAAKEYYQLSDYKDAIGKPCFEAFFGRLASCEGCAQPVSAMKGLAGTFERTSTINTKRLEQVVAYAVRNEAGEQDATIVRISDITQARLMERQLLQSEKLASLGLLVAGIAHEINNPNGFIVFNLPILRDYLEELMSIVDGCAEDHADLELFGMAYEEFRTDVFRLLEDMEHGSQRINATVSRLKEFARRRDKLEQCRVDLKQVIDRAATICRSEIRKSVRSFELDVPEELPPILSDSEAVEQIIINLLINATHASDKEDSWIRLSVVKEDKWPDRYIIEVSDNGCGIDEKTREKIFDPFFTTKPSMMGTGLGLYVCQNLAEGLGGRIEVESQPGRGSTFRVILNNINSGG
jgi:PAS domain S-box-containing protein